MFGISGIELLIIAAFVLIIFGPDKIPEIARTVGRFVNMFKAAQADMERMIKTEMYATNEDGSSRGLPDEPQAAVAEQPSAAPQIWAATEEDDEEEDEE